jgi:hypothetical protein
MQRRMRGAARFAAVAGIGGAIVLGSGGTALAKRSHRNRPAVGARAALIHYLKHQGAPALHAPRPSWARASNTAFSYNWSGYEDASSTHGAFSRVSGAWVVPKVVCTSEDQLTSEWVGIDGWSDSTVEQDGTLDWCYEGHAHYYTWYEMYPAATTTVGTTVQPGDHIAAVVSRSGTSYTLTVVDSTRSGDNVSKVATCAAATCLATSDEWIAERPAFSIGIAPLADYTAWKLTSGAGTKGGTSETIGAMGSSPIDMIDATGAYQLSSTSALTTANAFTTTWHNSY